MFDIGYVGPPARIESAYRKIKRSSALSFTFFAFGYSLFWLVLGMAVGSL